HCEKKCCQVCKKVCEQHCREECHTVCRKVQETCVKEVCCTVCRPVTECVMKEVCCTAYKEVTECCLQERKRTVCKPVTTYKTVARKCGEWVNEEYTVPGKQCVKWEKIPEECYEDPCTHYKCTKEAVCRKVICQAPPEVRCRKLWKERTVCEQVPCTTY